MVGELAQQRAMAGARHREVEREEGNGHRKHAVAEGFEPCTTHSKSLRWPKSLVSLRSDADDNFSTSPPVFEIADCLRHFAQGIDPVDGGSDFAGLDELGQDEQILIALARNEHRQALAHEG